MKFTQNYTVRWHDTNANREITPSALLTLMQETTNGHIKTNYPSIEYVRDELKQAFILSKVYMRFYEYAHAYDEITVNTWTGIESKGFSFYRSFEVLSGAKIIADALTVWALLDTETHKLLPAKYFENNFEDEKSIDIQMPRKIKFPDTDLQPVGTRKIVYGDIDYNRHMNNTHYPNMLIDFLPSPEHLRVKEMMISFIRGAQYGDELKMLRSQDGDNFYFRTLSCADDVCLEAYLKTEPRYDEIK